MNKKLIYGVIVLLIVSLFFLGCPLDVSDDSGSPNAPPEPDPAQVIQDAATEIAALLSGTGSGVTVDDTTIIINAGSGGTISSQIDVPSGVTIDIIGTALSATKINVVDGGVVNVNAALTATEINVANGGSANVDDDIIVVVNTVNIASGATFSLGDESTITITNMAVDGTYELGDKVSGTNNGVVTIGPNGVVRNGAGVSIDGNGTNIVKAGGIVYFNRDTVPFIGREDAIFNLTDGTFEYNNDGYVLDGTATLTVEEIHLTPDVPLTINMDSVLTIPEEAKLVLEHCANAGSLPLVGNLTTEGTDAPKIIWSSTEYHRSYSGIGNYYYFYENGFTGSAGEGSSPVVAPGTYVWNDPAVSGDPGWNWVSAPPSLGE
jgi:hypothetical protein